MPNTKMSSRQDDDEILAVLADQLPAKRWFSGKSKTVRETRLRDVFDLYHSVLTIAEVRFTDGSSETYAVPVKLVEGAGQHAVNALEDAALRHGLLEILVRESTVTGRHGLLKGRLTSFGASLAIDVAAHSRLLTAEQSNTSIVFDAGVFLKLYRKLEPGVNPDPEIHLFLEAQGSKDVPRCIGVLEYYEAGSISVVGMAAEALAHEGSAWETFLPRLLEDFNSQTMDGNVPGIADHWKERLEALGTTTGRLHLCLTKGERSQGFGTARFSREDQEAFVRGLASEVEETFTMLNSFQSRSPSLMEDVKKAHKLRPHFEVAIEGFLNGPWECAKARIHGDYHLGQVLDTGGAFVIIDFEGEPARTLAQRRKLASPLQDIAGLARSLQYLAFTAAGQCHDPMAARAIAESWAAEATHLMVSAWKSETKSQGLAPAEAAIFSSMFEAFILQKLLYEVRYELSNRPDWLQLPLLGLRQFCRARQ